MYTTTITLNPGNVLAANTLSSRYTCHQAVMALTGKQGRVLWRLETGIYPKLMVRSPDRPDLETFLCSRPGYAVDVICDRAEPDYKEGQILRFLLDANPTKRVNGSGHIRALEGDAEVYSWLARNLTHSGADLKDAAILDKQGHTLRRGKHAFRLFVVRLAGKVQVSSPEKFCETLYNGIGRGKGFGCGLLQICNDT